MKYSVLKWAVKNVFAIASLYLVQSFSLGEQYSRRDY